MKYLASRLAGLIIAVALLLSSLLSYGASPAAAFVGLTSFEVTTGNNNELVITWSTETEVDTLAFLLKRADVQDANAATEVARQQALGSGVGGASYEYKDTGLNNGTRYYYWLYEITTTGTVTEIGGPITEVPVQPTSVPTAPPTATRPATATATRPATATPTTQPAGNAPANNTPTPTNTQAPTNTPVATNTPIPINTSVAAAAAANAPASTNTPVPTNTPETAEQTNPAASATDTALPDVQPAPLTVGEASPATDSGGGERTEQGADVTATPGNPIEAAAATGLNSVDTPTAQAVAENNAQVTTAAPEAQQPTVARPTATPRPSRSDSSGSTTGLLAVIGGGSLLAAALLALVAFFIWRRR